MKNTFFLSIIFFLSMIGTSFAQRIVYVDTEFVLAQMSEYSEAQAQLESFVEEWNKDIVSKQAELISERAKYEQNKFLMPEAKRIATEQQLDEAANQLAALKTKRFGPKGDLFKKQQDLIKPIQDKVYNAVKQMASYRDYDMVLDRATGVSILFAKPKLDMSEEVLRIVRGQN